jgi:hypothetical protein
MALRIDARVITSCGRMSWRSTSIASRPASAATSRLRSSWAGTMAAPSGLMPITSNTIAIVFAVNCPPHAPNPGEAASSSSVSSASVSRPAECAPIPSNTSCTVTSRSRQQPGRMDPL